MDPNEHRASNGQFLKMRKFARGVQQTGTGISAIVGVMGLLVGATYYVANGMAVNRKELERVRDVTDEKIRTLEEKIKLAKEEGRRETAYHFLQLGFVEEYQRFQTRVGLRDAGTDE